MTSSRTSRRFALFVSLLAMAAAPAGVTQASEPPSLVTCSVLADPGAMPGDSIAVQAEVTNGHDEAVTVTFAPLHEAAGLDLEAMPGELSLGVGGSALVDVRGGVLAAGRYAGFLRGTVRDAAGTELRETVCDLSVRVTGGAASPLVATLEEFETLFGEEGGELAEGIGFVHDSIEGKPRGIRRAKTKKLRPDYLPIAQTPEEETGAIPRAGNITLEVRGEYRWIDTAGLVRTALGWQAAIWRQSGSGWVDTGARGWVHANGKFTVTASVPLNANVWVAMHTDNIYTRPMRAGGQRYVFNTAKFVANTTLKDVGAYYVDLNQVSPGLGEMHRNAYDLWWKLENVAEFSPVRSSPIQMVFPGTAQCSSCSLDGTVHILKSKGTDGHGTIHELGHEMMYEYWGEMPDDSGGYHEWPKCYSAGLALSEGFAHFVVWWTRVSRDAKSGDWFTGNGGGETPNDNVCKSIQRNELRVAATFWDLYDTRDDGVDTYDRVHPGTIFDMILTGGRANTLAGLIPVLASKGGGSWWKIEPIAEMNFAN